MNRSLLAGLLLSMLPVIALAAGDCFCLVDAADNFRHSCETQQQGIRQVTHCRDDAGNPYTLDSLSGWQMLPAGENRCDPCRQRASPTRGPIRGNGDEEAGDEPSDEAPAS